MELTPELQEKKIFLIEGLKKTYKDQYDAIQPLPYVKDRLYCVDKVFVEGGVEVCLAPELTRGTGGSWERLESYKSIYTDFRFKSKRRIIQGEPGYGKSTLTLQLAYDWCNDVSDSPINNVEILILLRLRQLGSVKSLFRAIKMFLLFHEPRVSKHEIEKIINSCSSVHITLDGYDEYPGRGSNVNDDVHRIIKMELFAEFDVSLTTRYLPESLREETKRAKLTGFDDKARDEYIRKAVVGNNDEAVEKIKQWLYENSILADLCQVPLIFVMFAHMANDEREVIKFKSVTQFFKHIIRCFYDHLKRKRKLYDDRNNRFYLHEKEHHELDKIAFEGFKINQQLSWIKTEFRKRVGPESYDQYILIGILVEEDVVSDDSTGDNVLFTTMVRFYHKLFCEWYAAHHLVTVVKKAVNLFGTLRFLDPVDLQYLFRFACGLDPDAGKELINYLQSLPGGDTFAILCILEQTGDVNDIMDAVTDLCSRDVKIKKGDSALLQRSTTQLLEIASNNHIPISCLHLEYSAAIKFEGDTLILSSGIPLPILPTVEKIHIYGSNAQHDNTETLSGIFSHRQETLTEKDILNLFRSGMKCRRIKELMFSQLQLPASVTPEALTHIMKTRNIRVRWRPFNIDFHLDLQNGHWEVVDNQVMEHIRWSTVSIDGKHSVLQQRSTVQLLHVAHRHNIPISSLLFNESFKTTAHETIISNNGIQLTNLPPLQKMHVVNKDDCNSSEITEQDIVNILLCAMKDQHCNVLSFEGCRLPVSVSSSSFTKTMISRAINVSWCPFDSVFHLDLQTGLWEVDDFEAIRDSFSHTFSINDSDTGLQHRSKVQLLYIAANHDTPISCVHVNKCVKRYGEESFVLQSGVRLAPLTTVQHICIEERMGTKKMRKIKTEMKNIFHFGMKCQQLQDILFRSCMLPVDNLSKYISSEMKERDLRVMWPDCGYRLNLQTGDWEVADLDPIRALCTKTVQINFRDSEPLQRYTIRLLENAAKYDIPITCLHLNKSFIKIDAGDIILKSGLHLSCPASVKKVVISTYREGREMTETEVVDILMFVQQSHMLEELKFDDCLLPLTFSSESIPAELQSRNIKVFWSNYGYSLDLQSGIWKVDDVDTVKRVCTESVNISRHDSELLQRCTVKLLENASYHDIPISCLHLEYSSIKFEGYTIILHSGISLPILSTVKKIHIDGSHAQHGNTGTLTDNDLLNLFQYGMKCGRVKELMFYQLQLPISFSPEAFTDIMKTQNSQVRWRPFDIYFHLDLETGHWEVDNIYILRQLCLDTINICKRDDTFKQNYTIMFINIASRHEIPIYCLHLFKSFSKIDAGDVILHSGLRLSCPVLVKKVSIDTEERREMTETEVVDILMFVQQSHMLEELKFKWCMLPKSIPAESIPSILKSRNVKVKWKYFLGEKYIKCTLNPQSGRWMHTGSSYKLTDTEYSDTVKWIRGEYSRLTELQGAKILSESESEGEGEGESEDEGERESESESEIQTESESDNEYND